MLQPKKILRNSAILALGLAASLTSQAQAEPVTITLLHTNDVYQIVPKRGKGGLAQLMTLLEDERAANPNTITTFGGDLFSPSVLSGLTQGAQMVELYNALGTDIAVVGNHEFDFGPDVAVARFGESEFPWLGGNMKTDDGEIAYGLDGSKMFEIEGYKIGVVGVITPETDVLSSPGDVIFEDANQTAIALAGELKDAGADLIIGLTHQNLSDDLALLRDSDGIDIVLGGHDHHPITEFQSGKLLIKAGYDAHYLAAIDLTIDRVEKRGEQVVVFEPSWRYRPTSAAEPHAGIQAIVDRYQTRLDEELGVEIGQSAVELDTMRSTVRSKESNFANLIADAMRNATGADLALTNGGGIRGDRTYDAGTVLTRKDVLAELPFGNVTVLVALSGADIRAALENGVSQVEDGAGRFPHLSGMTMTYDAAQAPGQRVVEITVGGEPLDDGKNYTLATNDYIQQGGDGFEALSRGKTLIDASGATLMASTVMNYITALGGTIAPEIEGRITRQN